MRETPERRDWAPVAPTWERNPDDQDIWKRVTTLPTLALNRAELDMLGVVAGKSVCVLGVGDGHAPLALAAMGARVSAIDPCQSFLDMLLIRTQLVGVEVDLVCSELTDLSRVRDGRYQLAYAAQAAPVLSDLGRFYSEAFRILVPGARMVVNEYHPFRRIWKQEPGHPRVRHSYFERRRERDEGPQADPSCPASGFARHDYQWTVSDHVFYLVAAGFCIAALEEVGEVRQHWEQPNLKGLPEQLIVAADKPGR